MSIKIKSAAEIARKWAEVTPGRASFYEAGLEGAADDWLRGASGAAGNYRSAVQAGDIERRYAGGVRRAGGDKWLRKARTLGVDRYGAGVAAAEEDMASGLEPYVSVIAGLTLPARKPRGDSANYARSEAVGKALAAKRVQLMVGAG